MASKARDLPDPTKVELSQLLQFGKERTEALLRLQKELLNEYEEIAHDWVARVKSEVELWSGLAAKVTASHSIPEGLEAYRDFASQRIQMAIEDGKRLFNEGQKAISVVTKSLNGKTSGVIN
jgi:Phasin protein